MVTDDAGKVFGKASSPVPFYPLRGRGIPRLMIHSLLADERVLVRFVSSQLFPNLPLSFELGGGRFSNVKLKHPQKVTMGL